MPCPITTTQLKGKIVLAGVGNVLKGDDGFGALLAQAIDGRVSFRVFDTGMAPENYLGVIVREKPDTIIFADTADFGGEPGEVMFLSAGDFSDSSFFLTHNTSLKMLFEFISMEGIKAEVFILCLQPEAMALGEDLSAGARREIRELSGWFIANFPGPALRQGAGR